MKPSGNRTSGGGLRAGQGGRGSLGDGHGRGKPLPGRSLNPLDSYGLVRDERYGTREALELLPVSGSYSRSLNPLDPYVRVRRQP